ncbi:hypothetical protein EDC04DRAFT_3136523 [Pisolithus marmoratus]|nr:hypothetical protein EDC04DRAFT_3136523 [Pisolithus marmoratus]
MPSNKRTVTAFVRKPPAVVLTHLYTGRAGVTRMCAVMGLNKKQWTSLREGIKPLILKYLDVEKSFLYQSEADLARLKEKALTKITFFKKYEDAWIIDVLVRFVFTHRYALVEEKQRSPSSSSLSDTEELTQVHQHSSPKSSPVKATESNAGPSAFMLNQFLKSIKASHFLFCFMRAGLHDDTIFTEFITSPWAVKKSFIEAALQRTASDDEVQAVLAAAQRY